MKLGSPFEKLIATMQKSLMPPSKEPNTKALYSDLEKCMRVIRLAHFTLHF